MRISAHSLRIHTGRYGRNAIPRNERLCLACGSGDIEDIFHFICVCPCYNELRIKHIPVTFSRRPSMYKFMNLLSSGNANVLFGLSLFIKNALKIRNTTINTV